MERQHECPNCHIRTWVQWREVANGAIEWPVPHCQNCEGNPEMTEVREE